MDCEPDTPNLGGQVIPVSCPFSCPILTVRIFNEKMVTYSFIVRLGTVRYAGRCTVDQENQTGELAHDSWLSNAPARIGVVK